MEHVDVAQEHGMGESLHVLGNDIGVLRIMHYGVDEHLIDLHVFSDVGAVSVVLQSI